MILAKNRENETDWEAVNENKNKFNHFTAQTLHIWSLRNIKRYIYK